MINQKSNITSSSLRYKTNNMSVCDKWKKDLIKRVLRMKKIKRILNDKIKS